jgi:hypothetical protein
MREIGAGDRHEVGHRSNNRAENSHQLFRRRERAMQRFRRREASTPRNFRRRGITITEKGSAPFRLPVVSLRIDLPEGSATRFKLQSQERLKNDIASWVVCLIAWHSAGLGRARSSNCTCILCIRIVRLENLRRPKAAFSYSIETPKGARSEKSPGRSRATCRVRAAGACRDFQRHGMLALHGHECERPDGDGQLDAQPHVRGEQDAF